MLGVSLNEEKDLKEADVLIYTFTQNILQVGGKVGGEVGGGGWGGQGGTI